MAVQATGKKLATSFRAGVASPALSWFEEQGAPGYARAATGPEPGHTTSAVLSVSWLGNPFGARTDVFASTVSDPVEYMVAGRSDSVTWLNINETLASSGISVSLDYRDRERRGVYARGTTTFRTRTHGSTTLGVLLASTVPDVSTAGYLGIRYVLFEGDLDLDLSIRGRYWSRFAGRALHVPTGLLVLRPPGSQQFGESGTVDVYFEGVIRTATVFASLENVLSGYTQPGALLVPVYPLSERQFRFGVFWRILG
jgi:hypothetical protein